MSIECPQCHTILIMFELKTVLVKQKRKVQQRKKRKKENYFQMNNTIQAAWDARVLASLDEILISKNSLKTGQYELFNFKSVN